MFYNCVIFLTNSAYTVPQTSSFPCRFTAPTVHRAQRCLASFKALLGGGCEQIRQTQDEPQWIVAQRLLSALKITWIQLSRLQKTYHFQSLKSIEISHKAALPQAAAINIPASTSAHRPPKGGIREGGSEKGDRQIIYIYI